MARPAKSARFSKRVSGQASVVFERSVAEMPVVQPPQQITTDTVRVVSCDAWCCGLPSAQAQLDSPLPLMMEGALEARYAARIVP